jgi:hypothetical protein
MNGDHEARDVLASLLTLKAWIVPSEGARKLFEEALNVRRDINGEVPGKASYRTELVSLLRTGAELFPADAAVFLAEADALTPPTA